MRNHAVLLAALWLGACGASGSTSPPPEQYRAPEARAAPRQTDEQREAMAASRDSSATQDDIKGVQGRLQREGFYHGPIDGVWGTRTQAALRKYQSAHSLAVTGKLNAETQNSFSAPEQAPPPPTNPAPDQPSRP